MEVTCTNLVLVRIWKKINNDKRRDMVVRKVVAHLCLTLIIWLKFNNDKRRRDMVLYCWHNRHIPRLILLQRSHLSTILCNDSRNIWSPPLFINIILSMFSYSIRCKLVNAYISSATYCPNEHNYKISWRFHCRDGCP